MTARIENQPANLDGSARHGDVQGPITVTSAHIKAYEAALYWIDLPTGRITLRIGQSFEPPRGIESLARLAVVTACNPFSQVFGEAENTAKQATLVEAVEAAGLEWFHAAGVDVQEKWTPEPSLAILDPSDQQLDSWMETFGQNAVVVAESGGLALLRLHPRASC